MGKLQYFTNLKLGHVGMIPLTNYDFQGSVAVRSL